MSDALDSALAVDRSAYAVGQQVYVRDEPRDETWTGTITAIDWNRGAGPILVESADGEYLAMHQPWDVTPVPRTLDEIEAFLAG